MGDTTVYGRQVNVQFVACTVALSANCKLAVIASLMVSAYINIHVYGLLPDFQWHLL